VTPARLKTIVRQVRYKPGWNLQVDRDSGDIVFLAGVYDSYHPRRKPVDRPQAFIVITPRKLKGLTTAKLLEWIHDMCRRLEFHEVGEWLKYRGRRPFDPHKG
jgi:hypothetical protein